ncbi:MAG: AAA domain-containing protein [Proteobacteria bacterium]|nr:AAA domain-containing protein [Pseudomonadota bacterium]
MASFNPKGVSFDAFVRAMDAVGYIAVDPDALMSAYLTVQDMAHCDATKGPIKTLILDGPPGTGKSFIAECLAQLLGGDYLEYNCHPDSSFEDFVKDINIEAPVAAQSGYLQSAPTKEDLYLLGPLLQAIKMSATTPVVFLIDELDKARPAVDALLLTTLNSGRITVMGLGQDGKSAVINANRQNILIVIAKNDERDLHPALLRRGRVIYIDYPHPDIETRIIREQAGVGPEAARSIVTQANKLRKNKSISKPPSLPELVRLAQDFRRMADAASGNMIKETDGSLTCRVPKEQLNKAFLNGMLAKAEDQHLGRQLLKDKSFGTAFLSAVLRGLGVKDTSIRYLQKSSLLAGSAGK